MSNGKVMIIHLIIGVTKKDIAEMSEYFPEPKSFGKRVKVKFDLSNYVTKADLRNSKGVDTPKFVKKVEI